VSIFNLQTTYFDILGQNPKKKEGSAHTLSETPQCPFAGTFMKIIINGKVEAVKMLLGKKGYSKIYL